MSYTDVFGGALVYPSELSYQNLNLSAITQLNWPEETSSSVNVASRIMDVTPSAPNLYYLLPDATKGGAGATMLFNNLGADSFEVRTAVGVSVATLTPGTAWQVYLTSNATVGGSWRAFQYASFVSQANAASLAGVGLTTSASTLVPDLPVNSFNSSRVSGVADRGQMFAWNGAAGTFTLPDPAVVGDGWYVQLKNLGTGSLTVQRSGSSLIDGATTKVLDVRDSGLFVSDGLNFYVLNYGQDAVFAFDNVSIDVSGTGTHTLTGSQLNRVSYNFTGLLTGNREIVVPATIQQYWVRNSTTGSFSLTVKVLGQPGTGVTQGGANILYCDGIDVRSANTGGIATPISIGDGGTGATTASAARTNLGAGAVGNAVFVSVTSADAYAALGKPPAGVIDGGVF